MDENVKRVIRGLQCCKEWGMTEKDCAGNRCPYEAYETMCVTVLHREAASALLDANLPPPGDKDYAMMLEECIERGAQIRQLKKDLAAVSAMLAAERRIECGSEADVGI